MRLERNRTSIGVEKVNLWMRVSVDWSRRQMGGGKEDREEEMEGEVR